MPSPLLADFRVESLASSSEYRAATQLYTRVFGYTAVELGLNANLLAAASRNGGSAVGAFATSGELIGFAYGFAGTDRTGAHFHYSQAAVVDAAHQGFGVGRALKTAQREIARGWGQTHMRWTFDPLLTRNAHFNFVSLRAEGMHYERDYYARPGTDRLVVDWDLTRTADPFAVWRGRPAPAELAGRAGAVVDTEEGVRWVAVPRTGVDTVTSGVRAGLERALDGRRLVSCVAVDADTSAYLALPADHLGGHA